jgi:hypothetical protein
MRRELRELLELWRSDLDERDEVAEELLEA